MAKVQQDISFVLRPVHENGDQAREYVIMNLDLFAFAYELVHTNLPENESGHIKHGAIPSFFYRQN